MSIRSLRRLCEEAERYTLDVVNVTQGVSAEIMSVDDSVKLRDAAKAMGTDPDKNRLMYIVVSDDDIAGGLYAHVSEDTVRMVPVILKDWTGRGVGEILCNLARSEFRDNYADKDMILELVVGQAMVPLLKKEGFVLKDNIDHDTVTARLLPGGERVQEVLEA